MVYEPVKSGQNRRTPITRTIRNAQTGQSWTRILKTRSPDFLIGHIDWEHAPGGGKTRDQRLIAELFPAGRNSTFQGGSA
jgi:hypothetical protein